MSTEGRLPSPGFDDSRYERPQKDWLCGHACDGCPCRLGPSPQGGCRAGPECKPILVTPPGETSGVWKCTRPADLGGPCPEGPRPDGACCRVTPPCVPVRSLRARRGLLVRATIAACVGLLLLVLFGPWRDPLVSPGPLASVHASLNLTHATIHGVAPGAATDCAQCHAAASRSPSGWVASALATAAPGGPLATQRILSDEARDFLPMDASCQTCHRPHAFHEANVARGTSCSVCHLEHRGRDQDLLAVSSAHCTACHGDAMQMSVSGLLAHTLPSELFEKPLPPGRFAFAVARPAQGLTAPITSFGADHPEFRLNLPGGRDPDPLAFNHARHLFGADIPSLGGKPLECQSCHRPDPTGTLMLPVRFADHCQSCHGLPIDPATPSLTVPHGSAETARAWLRALPSAYNDDAVRRLGLSGRPLRDYVAQKLAALRRLHPTGEALERKVFFGDPSAPAGRDSCNLCHVVEATGASSAARIVPPRMPDIWMPRAHFDHGRHTQVACTACHAAQASTATADILMPSKAVCATCHGSATGVTASCTSCHRYHNAPPSEAAYRLLAESPLTEAAQDAFAPPP